MNEPALTLEQRIQRIEDIHEIQNLMSRHEYMLSALENERELEELFARDAPGVTFEAEGLGVWEGRASIRRCYVDALKTLVQAHADGMGSAGDPTAGFMWEHCLTTPLIEVAQDGRTAKGMWTSPGAEALAIGGELVAQWNWVRYGIDFIREDGRWKFWHFHIYRTFATPFHKSWVETALEPPVAEPAPQGFPAPDRPNTYHDPYSPSRVPRRAPKPPEPYRTFAETWSYADPPRHNEGE